MKRKTWLEKFIQLADSNAQARKFKIELSIKSSDIPRHIKNINEYRTELYNIINGKDTKDYENFMNGNKIFCIGLPKTGTVSMNQFLNSCKIRSLHFGQPEANEIRNKIYRGIYKFDTMKNYDALTNCGENYFAQLDHQYPGSKFVFTTRDKERWLISIKKHWDKTISEVGEKAIMGIHHHLIVFGCYLFNRDRFSYVYDTTHMLVNDYFKDRCDCFTFNIDNKDVSGLKVFLGLNNAIAFPHSNKG